MTNPLPQLRADLDAIGAQAQAVLRREHRKQATWPALRAGAMLSAFIGVGLVAYLGIATLCDLPFPVLAWPAFGAAIVAPGALYALTQLLSAAMQSVSTDAALAAADSRHGLADRLRTAAEFLASDDRSPFMDAALVDASTHTTAAKGQGLPEQSVATGSPPATLGWISLALACLIAAAWIPGPASSSTLPGADGTTKVANIEPIDTKDPPTTRDHPPAPKPADRTPAPAPQQQRQAAQPSKKNSQAGADQKKTQGAMGSGQSADAASASGKSRARGAPSSQAQASEAGKKSKKKQTSKKPKKPKPQETPEAPKKSNEDSGSTAGRGAASGSNKSPSAAPWNSKDQVTSEDEDDLEDDEEVDDEFDDSDARGGVQPHLRDRRPPVNRDLGIGFGNNKNPDANGRGGPSEQKKSRGVASLVLGVPIPDHIKGRPNPGKTKITQERVEPQAQTADAAKASPRTPRQTPVGYLTQPQLVPWMRDLVRSYFQSLRARPADKTKPPAPGR